MEKNFFCLLIIHHFLTMAVTMAELKMVEMKESEKRELINFLRLLQACEEMHQNPEKPSILDCEEKLFHVNSSQNSIF